MSNGTQSAGRTPVTGEPVDVTEAQAKAAREKATREAAKKVREAVEAIGDAVAGTIAPPGTPSLRGARRGGG
ncbi:MAG TPA: hypothetical protein VF017_21595 [Thermoanaerobaculia bacterium]|nr:hypothetical protein [Thermoanaerobaculia bacterium]